MFVGKRTGCDIMIKRFGNIGLVHRILKPVAPTPLLADVEKVARNPCLRSKTMIYA